MEALFTIGAGNVEEQIQNAYQILDRIDGIVERYQ